VEDHHYSHTTYVEVFSDTVDYTEEYESESTERMILTQIDPMHLENTQEESQEEEHHR
jgi:hypothetical protein